MSAIPNAHIPFYSQEIDDPSKSSSPQHSVMLDGVQSMLRQEETFYKCTDYINTLEEKNQVLPNMEVLNEFWRDKICEWYYEVVDLFEISREVVSISLNLLDRFLAKVSCEKAQFQLAAIATLNIAIKLQETRPLKLATFMKLSRGCFTVENIIDCEFLILQTLSWHVHPPTSLSFARIFLKLLPSSIPLLTKNNMLEYSEFMLEVAVCEYSLVASRPSVLAFAAILNSIQDIGSVQFPSFAYDRFLEDIYQLVGLNIDPEVTATKEKMKQLYTNTEGLECDKHSVNGRVDSPTCVSSTYV